MNLSVDMDTQSIVSSLDKYLGETEKFITDVSEIAAGLGIVLEYQGIDFDFLEPLKSVMRTILRFVADVLDFLLSITDTIFDMIASILNEIMRAEVLYRFARLVAKQMILAGAAVEKFNTLVNMGLPEFNLHSFKDKLAAVDAYLSDWLNGSAETVQIKLGDFRERLQQVKTQLTVIL